jgi:hypothetical protein
VRKTYEFPPNLKQGYTTVPIKQRLVALMGLLHGRFADNVDTKGVVFFGTRSSVDFHFCALTMAPADPAAKGAPWRAYEMPNHPQLSEVSGNVYLSAEQASGLHRAHAATTRQVKRKRGEDDEDGDDGDDDERGEGDDGDGGDEGGGDVDEGDEDNERGAAREGGDDDGDDDGERPDVFDGGASGQPADGAAAQTDLQRRNLKKAMNLALRVTGRTVGGSTEALPGKAGLTGARGGRASCCRACQSSGCTAR